MALDHLKVKSPATRPTNTDPEKYQRCDGPECNATAKPKKDKPAKKPQPMFRFLCGHERPLCEIAGRNCPACRERSRQMRIHKRKVTRAKCDSRPAAIDRLPLGSTYTSRYIANGKWEGSLFIANDGDKPATFTLVASSIRKLLFGLDEMYRRHLAETLPEYRKQNKPALVVAGLADDSAAS